MEVKYRPSDASKANEDLVKTPLIEEFNMMGAEFDAGKISQIEWDSFKKDWRKRLCVWQASGGRQPLMQ